MSCGHCPTSKLINQQACVCILALMICSFKILRAEKRQTNISDFCLIWTFSYLYVLKKHIPVKITNMGSIFNLCWCKSQWLIVGCCSCLHSGRDCTLTNKTVSVFYFKRFLYVRFLERDFQMFNFLARFGNEPSTVWSDGVRQCHSLYNCKYSVQVPSALMTFLLCYDSSPFLMFSLMSLFSQLK